MGSLKNAEAQRRKGMKEELSYEIIGAAIEVHQNLGGPGLLESIYEAALCHELSLRRLRFQKQLILPVKYKGVEVKEPLCLDLLVENSVIIEIKATEPNHNIHKAQLLTYLRLTNLKLGILINFGQELIKDGIFRIANGL